MSTSFHNTINLSGPELRSAQSSAKSQEAEILKLFRQGWQTFTPSEILRQFDRQLDTNVPITSIRRGITNLTTQGFLVKLDDTRRGPLGKPEHLWALVQSAPTQSSLFEEASL